MSNLTIEVKNDAMLGRTTEKALHIELIKKDKEIERLNNTIEEKDKEIDKLNKRVVELRETIRLANNNVLKDISMINTIGMEKQEIIQRLLETSKILEGVDKLWKYMMN